jgi:predicted RNase H-like nuclease (RuvC/YqgF family)
MELAAVADEIARLRARVAVLEEQVHKADGMANEVNILTTANRELRTRITELEARLRRVQRAARVLASHATWAIETCEVCGDGVYVVNLKRFVLTDCGRGVLACPECIAIDDLARRVETAVAAKEG